MENGIVQKDKEKQIAVSQEGSSNNTLFIPYIYHIGNGNNSQMVKSLMNSKWWWRSHTNEDIKEVNFLWTQWKNKSHHKELESKIQPPLSDLSDPQTPS
jgi:hypothetical protein